MISRMLPSQNYLDLKLYFTTEPLHCILRCCLVGTRGLIVSLSITRGHERLLDRKDGFRLLQIEEKRHSG